MAKGDIVLITFPFTNLSGTKLRPAVVLAETNVDLTVCFITTQIQHTETTDIILKPTSMNGLKTISLIRTNKISTLEKLLVKGIIGKLTHSEISVLNNNLKTVFQLP